MAALGQAPAAAVGAGRLGEYFLSGGIFFSRSIFPPNYAFSYLNLAQASIFTNLVTMVSIAAGIVFLGESFTALQGIGSMAILTGVYLSNHIKGRTE